MDFQDSLADREPLRFGLNKELLSSDAILESHIQILSVYKGSIQYLSRVVSALTGSACAVFGQNLKMFSQEFNLNVILQAGFLWQVQPKSLQTRPRPTVNG